MKTKKVLHVCTGCGKEKALTPNKRHWCDCNPGAKFFFIAKSDKALINKIVGAFTGKAK